MEVGEVEEGDSSCKVYHSLWMVVACMGGNVPVEPPFVQDGEGEENVAYYEGTQGASHEDSSCAHLQSNQVEDGVFSSVVLVVVGVGEASMAVCGDFVCCKCLVLDTILHLKSEEMDEASWTSQGEGEVERGQNVMASTSL